MRLEGAGAVCELLEQSPNWALLLETMNAMPFYVVSRSLLKVMYEQTKPLMRSMLTMREAGLLKMAYPDMLIEMPDCGCGCTVP